MSLMWPKASHPDFVVDLLVAIVHLSQQCIGMASFQDIVAEAKATKKYLESIQTRPLDFRREAWKERHARLIGMIESSALSATQAADLIPEVQAIKWAKAKSIRKKRSEKLETAIHKQLLASATVATSGSNSARSSNSASNNDTKYQDFRAIVNYIPDSFWGGADFANDLLLLARDLGLRFATEDTIGALALLNWVNELGGLDKVRRVSPHDLYDSVKTCKKNFAKLEQFHGQSYVKVLPRNVSEFKDCYPDLYQAAFGSLSHIPDAPHFAWNDFERALAIIPLRSTHQSLKAIAGNSAFHGTTHDSANSIVPYHAGQQKCTMPQQCAMPMPQQCTMPQQMQLMMQIFQQMGQQNAMRNASPGLKNLEIFDQKHSGDATVQGSHDEEGRGAVMRRLQSVDDLDEKPHAPMGCKRKSLEEITKDLVGGIRKSKSSMHLEVGADDEEDEDDDEQSPASKSARRHEVVKANSPTSNSAKAKASAKAKVPKINNDAAIDVKYKVGETYKVCDESTRHCTRIRCSDGTSFSIPYSKYGTREKTLMHAREWVRLASFARPPAKIIMKRPAKKKWF